MRDLMCRGCEMVNPAGTRSLPDGKFEPIIWRGPCPNCGRRFNIVAPRFARADGQKGDPEEGVISASEVSTEAPPTIPTGVESLDNILNGGIVPGSVVLICGAPGSGKSTLLSTVMINLSNRRLPVLGIIGEEALQQVVLRLKRLSKKGQISKYLQLSKNTDIDEIIENTEEIDPSLLIVDSINLVSAYDDNGEALRAGSIGAINTSLRALRAYAERNGTPVFVIGHVDKALDASGPMSLQHMVDVCLFMEHNSDDAKDDYRWLKCPQKNRFGSAGPTALARLLMTANGLVNAPLTVEKIEKESAPVTDTAPAAPTVPTALPSSTPWTSPGGITEREVLAVACAVPDCRGTVDRACTAKDGTREKGFHESRVEETRARKRGAAATPDRIVSDEKTSETTDPFAKKFGAHPRVKKSKKEKKVG